MEPVSEPLTRPRYHPCVSPHTLIRLWLIGLCAAIAVVPSARARAQPSLRPAEIEPIQARLPGKRILLLHSYTTRVPYTRAQDTAIREGVARGYPGIANFYTAELDFSLDADMDTWPSVHEFLRDRYSERELDLIIATDTAAMRFLHRFGPVTFPGVPIVFSASRRSPGDGPQSQMEITGVFETIDVRGTIELILRLHPGTRRLLIINKTSIHGSELREKTLAALDAMRGAPEIEWLEDLGFDAMTARLASAPHDSAVLFLTYWDATGKLATLEGTLREFARVCPRPIYILFDSYLGFGTVGGRVASAEAYGEAAARMAVRVLKGEKASDIPMVVGTNPTMLDARQLARFHVPPELIPTDATILFDEPTFLERNAGIIAVAAAVTIIEGAIIGWLVLSRRSLKRTTQALRASEEQHRLVFEATIDVMWDWDIASNKIEWSESLATTFGASGEGLVTDASACFDRIHPDDVRRVADGLDRFVAGDLAAWRDEYRFRRTDGSYAWVADRASLVRDDSGKAVRVIGAMTDVTTLRDTERRLRAALEAGSMATWEWDLDAQVIHHSDGMGPMFNLPPGEGSTAQDRVVEQIIPEDRPVKLGAVHGAFDRADGALSVDYRVARPDGSIRWLSCQGRVMQDEGGSKRRLFGVTIDITRMKDAEAALRESEERYRGVVESLPVGVLVHDGERLYFANESTRAMFRADSLERLLRTSFARLVHPDHHANMPERIRLILEKNRHLDPFEVRLVAFDGAAVHAEIQCSPTQFSGKTLVQTTIHDLTERRRAELSLRESEEKFRQITENAAEVFWLADVESNLIRYISPAFEHVWGLPREPFLKNSSIFYSTIHPDDRDRVEHTSRNKSKGFDHEFRIVRPDGTIRWVRDRAYPVPDSTGRIVRVAGVAQDITEAKAAEESLRRTSLTQQLLLSELDHRVKNSLSGLLTLIDLTRAATTDIQDFADSIRARVLAMASVHTLLSEGHWAPVSMPRMIRSLRPPEAIGTIETSGPPIDIPARQATALAMIVQELFTNSLKHGAAADPDGTVHIHWEINAPQRTSAATELVLEWNESGGRPIALPVSPGVGTRLIQGFCKFELNGECDFHYAPEGIAHQFRFRLDGTPSPLIDVKPHFDESTSVEQSKPLTLSRSDA